MPFATQPGTRRSSRCGLLHWLTAALLFALPANAQNASTAQPGATATVHGVVINGLTRQPVAHVLVALEQSFVSVLTDNEGHFTFEGVPLGEVSLSARRPGFADPSGSDRSVRRVTLAATSPPEVTVAIWPLGSITGELVRPSDEPPDGIQLQLLHQEIRNGRGHWSMYRMTTVSTDAHFRFGNLQPGDYLVHVSASLDPVAAIAPPGSPGPRQGYVPVFYPGARDIAGAGELHLGTGQTLDIRVPVTREPFYSVTLPVSNPEEARGVRFGISSESFLGLSARFSPDDDSVHVDLPNGHYVLQASSFGARSMIGLREFDVNGVAGKGVTGPPITLLPSSRIPVTVHAEFTHLAAPQPGSGSPTAAGQISMELQREGSATANRGSQLGLQDDANSATTGVSQLIGVAPGRYWVNATAYNGYIASVTSGGVNLLEQPLVVSADGSASPIEVVLRDDVASLSATLGSSLQPAAQDGTTPIYLQVVPESGTAISRTASFGPDGTLQISNLAPGTYLAFASSTQQAIAYRDPRILATIAREAQTITLEPGATARVTLESLAPSPGQASAGGTQ